MPALVPASRYCSSASPGRPSRGSVRYDLGRDQYFVVGDNRAVSFDSVQLGPVTRERISGKAVFRYAPLGKLGTIK